MSDQCFTSMMLLINQIKTGIFNNNFKLLEINIKSVFILPTYVIRTASLAFGIDQVRYIIATVFVLWSSWSFGKTEWFAFLQSCSLPGLQRELTCSENANRNWRLFSTCHNTHHNQTYTKLGILCSYVSFNQLYVKCGVDKPKTFLIKSSDLCAGGFDAKSTFEFSCIISIRAFC